MATRSRAGIVYETDGKQRGRPIGRLLLRIGVRIVFVYNALFCLFIALLSTLAYEIRYGAHPPR